MNRLRIESGDGRIQGLAKDLFPRIYQQMREIAHRMLGTEKRSITLRTTALVNEAYIKLSGLEKSDWASMRQFLLYVSRTMRSILVDHGRSKIAQKRGKGIAPVGLSADDLRMQSSIEDFLALHEALNLLARTNERKAKIVELRFFMGLANEEIAGVLEISPATVGRDWKEAKEWLARRLAEGNALAS